jgi:hypothetical protein
VAVRHHCVPSATVFRQRIDGLEWFAAKQSFLLDIKREDRVHDVIGASPGNSKDFCELVDLVISVARSRFEI